MKKLTVAMSMVVMMVSCSFGATSLYWGSETQIGSGSGGDVLDRFGSEVSAGSDWYLQLFDTSDTTWDPLNNPTGGEIRNSTDAFPENGEAYETVSVGEAESELNVGTRLYDSTDPSSADYYVLGSLTHTLPTMTGDLTDPLNDEYDFGVMGQDGSEWQAVPEPAVTLFALIGVGTIFYRRRRMRNQ